MEDERFFLGAAGIFLMTVAAWWIHGPSTRNTSWTEVAAEAPCDTFQRAGRDLKVKHQLVIDGKGDRRALRHR